MMKPVQLICGLAVFLLLSPAQALEKTTSALSACPPDATLVFQVSSAKQMIEKIKESPPAQLGQRAEFADLFKQMEAGMAELSTEVKAELDIDFWDTLGLIEGEVLLVLGNAQSLFQAIRSLSEADAGQEGAHEKTTQIMETLPFLLVMDGGNSGVKLGDVLGKVKNYLTGKGAKVDTSTFHGGQLTTIKSPDAGSGYLGEVGSRFLFGFSRNFVEQTMVNLSSGSSTGLTTNAVFQKTHRESKGAASDVFVYLSIAQITDAVGPTLGPGMPGMIWHSLRELLFGRSFNSIGMAGILDGAGVRQSTFLHNNGASDGVLDWFKGTAFPKSPLVLIPPEAATFSSTAFNSSGFGDFVRGVMQIVASFQGPDADMNAMVQGFLGVGLDELLRSLGGRIHFFSFATVPNPNNPLGDQTVLVELRDETPLRTVFENSPMLQGAFERKEYLGRTIYRSVSAAAAVSFCITDRMLILSFSPDGAEKVIRRVGKQADGIGDTAEYKQMAASVPASVSVLSYSNSKYASEYLSGILETVMQDAPDEVPQEIFLFLTALGKTLGASIGFGQWQDAGLYLETSMRFQQLK